MRTQAKEKRKADTIVLHHSALSKLDPQIEIVKAHHNNKWGNKMKDGAYHAFIEKSGKIIWHPDGLDAILYHAGNWNQRAIGVCIAGHLGQEPLLKEQIDSLISVIDHIKHYKTIKFIYNHREVRPTSCPSIDLRYVYESEKRRREPSVHSTDIGAMLHIRSITRAIERARGTTREILLRRLERLKMRL